MKPLQLTLNDVQQLSAEVRALTEARLPLEQHLADAGRGHGRRIELLCNEISGRLQAGESIDHIVDGQSPGASRMLTAALAAGIRSGDMATSIELLGDLSNDLVETRTRLTRAMAYPLVICVLAGALFLVAVRQFLKQVFETLLDLGTDISPVFYHLYVWDERYPHWPWICPIGLLVIAALWLIRGRGGQMAFHGSDRVLLMIPGVRSLIRDLHFYMLTRMTGLLVQRQMPLPEALTLAGNCVGDDRLEEACSKQAASIRQGTSAVLHDDSWRPGQMPPLLQASVTHPVSNDDELIDRLRGVAGHYHRRIGLNLAWLQHVIPAALLVVFAGGAVFTYGMLLMWPVAKLYQSLSTF